MNLRTFNHERTGRTLTIALVVIVASLAHGQSLSILNVDPTAFPTITSRFYAFDAAGNRVTPASAEFTVKENGISRTVTSVNCPSPLPPQGLSSVLTIDISASMGWDYGNGTSLDLAKAAADAWVQGLALGTSECAITSFDQTNFVNQYFTTDSAALLRSIAALVPEGGTDYDQGLLQRVAGGLQISSGGSHKRVIVFLTDGVPNREPNTAAIIAEARKQNCAIYAVTLHMQCPQCLKDISEQTGGGWYENVTTVQDAQTVYRTILQTAQQELPPCTLTWLSGTECSADSIRRVSVKWSGQTTTVNYTAPASASPFLKFSPRSVFYHSPTVLTKHDTVITVTATNGPINVLNITSSNAAFDINPKTFSLIAGGMKPLTVSYTPIDSAYAWTEFDVVTDACPAHCGAEGSYPAVPPKKQDLRLTFPNGKEKLIAGSDTNITWIGVPLTDTVRLEYSLDSGQTWTVITQTATAGKYLWHVPSIPSTHCLARVEPLFVGGDSLLFTLRGHTAPLIYISWSADSSKIATSSLDSTLRIWDAVSGVLIKTLVSGSYMMSHSWCPDSKHIASSSWFPDKAPKIWNVQTGLYTTLTGFSNYVQSVSYSHNGKFVAGGSGPNVTGIWDASTGALLHSVGDWGFHVDWSPDDMQIAIASELGTATTWLAATGVQQHNFKQSDYIRDVRWSPDGRKLITTCCDGTAKLWDAMTGLLIKSFSGSGCVNSSYIEQVAWSPDGNRFLLRSNGDSIEVYDAGSYNLLFSLHIGFQNQLGNVTWSPDGSRIAATAGNSGWIWDAMSGVMQWDLGGHTDAVRAGCWSPDGTRFATASADNTAKIWNIGWPSFLTDVSDALWSIVMPKAVSEDVDMGDVEINTAKDSLVTNFVRNIGTWPLRVDSIVIQQGNSSGFSVASNAPPFTIAPGGQHPVEYRFLPIFSGPNNARLVMYTQSDTLRQAITGRGIFSSLAIVDTIIDFGQVKVGARKDTLRCVTITNVGSVPLTITRSYHATPNDTDFTTLAGGGPFTLNIGDTARLDLRFMPSNNGKTSGRLLFVYNGSSGPATVLLFGEGIKLGPQITVALNAFPSLTCFSQSTQTVSISNTGSDTLHVFSASIGGADASAFSFAVPFVPVSIAPDNAIALAMQFTSTLAGARTATLMVRSDARTDSVLNLSLIGNKDSVGFGASDVAIDLGVLQLNSMKDTSVLLFNTGTLTDVYTAACTEVTSPQTRSVLSSAETVAVAIHFPGRAVGGVINDSIVITDSICNRILTVYITGTIQSPASAKIQALGASAYPGDAIDIPILLVDSLNLAQSNATSLSTTVQFNASLLFPIGSTPSGTLSNNNMTRSIPLTFALPPTSSTLGVLHFRAMLGNDTSTALTLQNAAADVLTVAVTAQPGIFTLLGTCRQGGPQLFYSNGVAQIASVRPNPAQDALTIDITTIESGTTTLRLMNALGAPMTTIINGELTSGAHTFSITTSDLPTGTYYLELRTPTIREARRVAVVR